MSARHPAHRHHRRLPGGFLGRWFLVNTLASGVLALLWLILRSGPKPSRLAYPCQRAAAGTASAAFAAPLAAVAVAAWRRLTLWMRTPAIVASASLGLVLTVSLFIYFSQAADYRGPVLDPPRDYRAALYHVTACPENPAGDYFVGLENLLVTMGRGGLKFYRSATVTPVAGPDGLIAPNDVVVIKINYQWDQRGGTNTDLLRGLIRAVVNHPDGFTGELMVCENAQFNSTSGLDRAENNAQDHSLSPHDVVAAFQALGYHVSQYDWTPVRTIQVGEYSTGDMRDGYVVGSYDSRWQGKLSYPKFRATTGTYVSLKYGVWNPGSGTYNRARMKFLNMPVLKSHHATYGATVSTKHYMGVVTDQFSTNSHNAIRYGIMGALMGDLHVADLNIVDAIWINANPNSGPSTTYSEATRRDELTAGVDPIALDRWSVKNILIPGFLANGYSPPWPAPSADPDLATSAFRVYLDNSMNQLLAAGRSVTNDYAQMDVLNGNGAAGDFDGDSDVDLADYQRFAGCFTGEGGGPVGPECAAGDFDGDGDVDCQDWRMFKAVWTGPGTVPELPVCDATGVPRVGGQGTSGHAAWPVPNRPGSTTVISYTLAAPGPVKLAIFDVSGRLVRTMDRGAEEAGAKLIFWDGRDDRGEPVGRGVYPYRLDTPGGVIRDKLVIR